MHITRHAEKRMKQRMGLSRKSAHRIAQRAWFNGVIYKHLSGRMRRYIDALRFKNKDSVVVKVYGMFVYVFEREGPTLITVHHIANKFKRLKVED